MTTCEIFPAFKQQGAPIVFESSAYFIPYLSIALQTLIDASNSEHNYDIIILGDHVENVDKERICDQVRGRSNFSVRFFEPIEVVKPYIENAKYQYITVNYYRMALPWILKNYETALNLGADILVMKDIDTLCQFNFQESKYLAGASDLGYIGRLQNDIPFSELALDNPNQYINADVLIFNLKGIRDNYCLDQLMSFWQQYRFRCAEQDALNKLFDHHKQLISLRWNTYPDRMTSTADIMCTPKAYIKYWKKCLQDPFIVHFAAVPKPWDYPVVGFGKFWWDRARKSVYYEEIIKRMANPKVRCRKKSVQELLDLIFPKGSKPRIIMKKLKKEQKWGLNS